MEMSASFYLANIINIMDSICKHFFSLAWKSTTKDELENWAAWDGHSASSLSSQFSIDFASVINGLNVYAAIRRRLHDEAFLNLYSSFMKEQNAVR